MGFFIVNYFLVLFLFPLLGFSETHFEFNEISREDYASQFGVLFKKENCSNENKVLRKCFSLSQEKCFQEVTDSTKTCLNFKIKPPKMIDLTSDLPDLNLKLGACIGTVMYHKK